MYGKDYRYANTRLNGTIVRRGKHPVLVLAVEGDGMVYIRTIVTGKERKVRLEDLTLGSPDLGMVCINNNAIAYLGRIPKRNDWRQGLRKNNVGRLWGDRIEISDKIIYKAIRGLYPTLSTAIEDSTMEGNKIAVHRHWAIECDNRSSRVNLYYKWLGKVGSMSPDLNDIKLEVEGAYQAGQLMEALQEMLHAS